MDGILTFEAYDLEWYLINGYVNSFVKKYSFHFIAMAITTTYMKAMVIITTKVL